MRGRLIIRHGAYLPHWRREGGVYSVTFRLADSVPQSVYRRWQLEREAILMAARAKGRELTEVARQRLDALRQQLEAWLDEGHGACELRDPRLAAMVQSALLYFDSQRYALGVWCVMPNLVHAVVRPGAGFELSAILKSWKGFTGKRACELLGRPGPFWQPEPYDHLIRDRADFDHHCRYILENPAKASLRAWPWVGCKPRTCEILRAQFAS